MDDLIKALQLMRSKLTEDIRNPTHCEHDELTVMVDPALFTAEELQQLNEWGFNDYGDGVFQSFRFGSA
jgi:hypothetical protein